MSDTIIGTIIGSVGTAIGALLLYLRDRGKARADNAVTSAQLTEERRQKDITTIIETLQEDVASLREIVKAHEVTINALRLENYGLLGDRAQLANEVARLRARVGELEGERQLRAERAVRDEQRLDRAEEREVRRDEHHETATERGADAAKETDDRRDERERNRQ